MKLFLIFSILIFTNYSSATELLQGYDCKNADDAMQCTNCTQAKYKLEFKVNERTNKIIRFSYINNKFIQSVSLEDCNVVDGKNWVCEQYDELGFSNIVMRNGQYSHTTIPEKKYIGSVFDKNFCAK